MLLSLAEALGTLADRGCRPDRSIKIAHWDAEEYGILGSTEWGEQLEDSLQAGAVAYLNADGAVSGRRFGGAAVIERWVARGGTVRHRPGTAVERIGEP